jgi:nucleotide-binding universal stress UspA family protein
MKNIMTNSIQSRIGTAFPFNNPKEMCMYKRILVPLDGSEKAEKILPFTCMLARDNSAEIILLHVAEYPLEIYPTSYEYSYVDTRLAEVINHKKIRFRCEVKNYLANIAKNLEKEGFKVRTEVCEGPVVESILSATE